MPARTTSAMNGRGVDDEPEQQRHELRQHFHAAAHVEAPGLGKVNEIGKPDSASTAAAARR
jgi:hypothetical protein